MTTHVGVACAERGAALVGVERGEDDGLLVVGIERLPADLSAVIARLEDLEDDVFIVVDAADLGRALWTALGEPDEERWQLYTGRGVERQALVDRLLVAIHQDTFRFAPALAEQEAMSKALTSYRRTVREDGVIGGELVTALLLALVPPVVQHTPNFAWGRSPFAPPDEADGARVGGLTVRRTPDGDLVGLVEPPEEKP